MKRSFDELTETSPGSGSETTHSQQAEYKTLAHQVNAELRDELRYSVFSSTPHFLDTFFPVCPSLVEEIYRKACSMNPPVYSVKETLWNGFPREKTIRQEALLYEPFVNVANFITQSCTTSSKLPVRWLSDPNRSPALSDTKATDLKPDIVAVLNFPEPGPEVEAKKSPPKAPWSRIHVPMEVKKAQSEAPALLQLLGYQRQVFYESHDRRFVYGLVLAARNLYVYLADRSGVLGSEMFDMHTEPHKLIRVIAAIATLPASQLGWDTTMRAIPKQALERPSVFSASASKPSYEHDYSEGNPVECYWVVQMPMQKEGNPVEMQADVMETFILWKSISLSRAEVIRGRATRVWKAWHEKDMGLPESEREIYIVKDTWRDDRRDLEGKLYAEIGDCEGVAKLHSYCAVMVDEQLDTTRNLIRRDLAPEGTPIAIDARQKQVPRYPIHSPGEEWHSVTYYIDQDYVPRESLPEGIQLKDVQPRGKTHSRLVMKTYGRPIKFAKSLLEMVGAFKDAIVGHRNSFQRNVLHRDISIGNILIASKPIPGYRGILIDYENAIILNSGREPLLDDPLSGTRPFISPEILGKSPLWAYSKREGNLKRPKTMPQLQPKHDFIHDLESFFWVLVWLCMSRSGPARRREELITPNFKDDEFCKTFKQLFEGSDDVLVLMKSLVLKHGGDFDSVVIVHVTDWCEPLLPLLEKFYDILAKAYADEKRNFDVEIYEAVINAFQTMEDELEKRPADAEKEYAELREHEEARRHRDLQGHWDLSSPKTQKTAAGTQKTAVETQDPPTPPPTLPTYLEEPGSPTPQSKRAKTGEMLDIRNFPLNR
ncbi:hypothetical protein AcW2_010357 [Taiwanofungus camphoratus]|nr:hypothetical protein AcW2_010357 [Antrodia cinnamomea]